MLALLIAHPGQETQVQVLVFGVIKKIDAKAGVLTVTERVFPERRGARRGPPAPDLGPGFPPPGPRGPRGGDQIDTRISYSAETLIKASEQQLHAADLKVGDSVRITGTPTNKGIAAKEIERIKAAR